MSQTDIELIDNISYYVNNLNISEFIIRFFEVKKITQYD